MRTLYERIGGGPVIDRVVDDLYERLTHDPRVLHHFDAKRLPSLKAAQRAWLAGVLGDAGAATTDLAAAHQQLTITDDQIGAVIHHLDEAIERAGSDAEVRRQVIALVSRLWYARRF